MHLISVDLPDPEGPQITTFSPCLILRSMVLRALKSLNDFVSPCISTAKVILNLCPLPIKSCVLPYLA